MISKTLKVFQVLALCSFAFWAQGKQARTYKPNELRPTHRDIKYGSHPKELINFWQFDSDEPVGVLLQIHGGGWMGGKKDEVLRPHQLKARLSILLRSVIRWSMKGHFKPAMLILPCVLFSSFAIKRRTGRLIQTELWQPVGPPVGVPVYWLLCMMILPI
jgi:hypothetical protein